LSVGYLASSVLGPMRVRIACAVEALVRLRPCCQSLRCDRMNVMPPGNGNV
jgi:hypothetical protein